MAKRSQLDQLLIVMIERVTPVHLTTYLKAPPSTNIRSKTNNHLHHTQIFLRNYGYSRWKVATEVLEELVSNRFQSK